MPVAVRSTSHLWGVRILVVGAFVATLWLYGPRAAEVLAARLETAAQNSPVVELDRVGFAGQPAWLDQPLLVAVSAALAPWLGDEVAILDDPALRRLREGLAGVPWVREATVQRVFPDKLRVHLELRRPVIAVRAADGRPLCLVDREGIALPWADTTLPVVFLHREGGAPTMQVEPGAVCADPRPRAAAAIAVEWRDQLAPLVPNCPALVEIDATNLGERWLRGPRYPEVRVKLARRDGAAVVFAYDRPVDSPLPRLPVATKAEVLKQILAQHPQLDGLVAGDLRMARRWADWLQPRAPGVPDPEGRWGELPPPK